MADELESMATSSHDAPKVGQMFYISVPIENPHNETENPVAVIKSIRLMKTPGVSCSWPEPFFCDVLVNDGDSVTLCSFPMVVLSPTSISFRATIEYEQNGITRGMTTSADDSVVIG
jgi:hypothetical protein